MRRKMAGACALLLLAIAITSCRESRTERATRGTLTLHRLKKEVPQSCMLSIELPPEIAPDRIAIYINGVYMQPYMAGEVWRPVRAPNPPTEDPSVPYKVLILIDDEVKGGEIILLDLDLRLPFAINAQADGYWWVVEVSQNESNGDYLIYSGSTPSKGGEV